MMMDPNSQIQDLMLRYLNGDANAAEVEMLQIWIRESSANKEEFELVKRLWLDTRDAALKKMDIEKAWEQVYMQTIGKQAKKISLFPWKKMIAIAASVLLMISILYFFRYSMRTDWQETFAVNSNQQIQLSDGTIITLREGGKLLLPENFGKDSRKVKLEGEAYFEVKHDDRLPFSVITSQSIINDIGTAFLVQSSDSSDLVTVLEGEVGFASKGNKELELTLRAGESAVMANETSRRIVVDTVNLLSWKSNMLVFDNTPLFQVARDLERHYSIQVQLPEDLRSVHITAQFQNETLEQVLKELNLFTGLEFRMEGRFLMISKN